MTTTPESKDMGINRHGKTPLTSPIERAMKGLSRALQHICLRAPLQPTQSMDIVKNEEYDPEEWQADIGVTHEDDSPDAQDGQMFRLLHTLTTNEQELVNSISEPHPTAKESGNERSSPQLPIHEDEKREAVADLARVLADLHSAWDPSRHRELEKLARIRGPEKGGGTRAMPTALNDSLSRSSYVSRRLVEQQPMNEPVSDSDPGSRLACAVPSRIVSGLGGKEGDLVPEWGSLVGIIESELLGEGGGDDELLVEVNSGGKVFFGLLTGQEGASEEAVCIKFGADKLGTQSEFLAYELAGLMGVRSPDCRLIRKGQPEWASLRQAADELAKGQREGVGSVVELLSWMKSARCLLVIGFVPGSALYRCRAAFDPPSLVATAEQLGRVLVLDMVLCNPDRLPVAELGWRGNPNNLRCTAGGAGGELLVVGIDHTLARRPPSTVGCNKASCAKLCEQLLGQPERAGELLKHILGSWFREADVAAEGELVKAATAFLAGFRASLARCKVVSGGLEMLRDRMEGLTSRFFDSLGVSSEDNAVFEPSTVRLRQVQKQAKVEQGFMESFVACEAALRERFEEVQATLDLWRSKAGVEGQLTTGFLDSAQPLVQAYELKIRLEHILSRAGAMQEAAGRLDADAWQVTPGMHQSSPDVPVMVYPKIYIGGILAAGQEHQLRNASITHIVNATGDVEDYFPEAFEYLDVNLDDKPEAAPSLAAAWEATGDFIDRALASGGAVLVHCFEGRSRSSSLILAYLIIHKFLTLRDALKMLKTAHPPTCPNYGFMTALRELDLKVHGKTSTRPVRKPAQPEPKVCPICQKHVGISSSTLTNHMRQHHPQS